MYDIVDEISSWMGTFTANGGSSSLDATIVSNLMQMLDDSNQLVNFFRYAKHRLFGDCQSSYKLWLIGKRDNDSWEYDNPSTNDISNYWRYW